MTSLPFSQQLDKDHRRWRVMGIVSVELDGLRVEWRSDEFARNWRRAYKHLGRGQLHTVLLPWTVLDYVNFDGGLIGASKLRIRARTMNALDQLPGADGPYWSARVARGDRNRAREVSLAVETAISAATSLFTHRTRA